MSQQASPTVGSPGTQTEGLRPRQELAVRRFTQFCRGQWGHILFHKVGTGKTMTSLLIALNSMTQQELANPNVKIFVVSPTSAIFENFTSAMEKYLTTWLPYKEKLVDFNYPALIDAINNKDWISPTDKYFKQFFPGSVIIFDEAHRLLGKEINNSMEAGSNVGKHPIVEDIFFINKVNQTKKCIVMTGTPIQVDVSDICKLLNFATRSNQFTAENYAPIVVSRAALQWSTNILSAAAKSQAVPATAWGIGQAFGYAKSAASSLFGLAASALPTAVTQITDTIVSTAQDNAMALAIMAAVAVTAYGGKKIYNAYQEDKRKAVPRGNFESELRKGGTRKIYHKGGDKKNEKKWSNMGASNYLAQLAIFTVGPTWVLPQLFPDSGMAESEASKLLVEIGLAQMQDVLEELYENNWNIKKLAQDGSSKISVYDPDIQAKLMGQPYTPALLTTQKQNIKTKYNTISKSWSKNYSALTFNSSFQKKLLDTSPKLDMPIRTVKEVNILYNDKQLDLLREMFSGELSTEMKAVLNLDKYETKSPDVKKKYEFFRKYARMVGNFNDDIQQYYAVINAAGTDYELFERATGNQVTDFRSFQQRGGIFRCEKFEKCRQLLEIMRRTGKTIEVNRKELSGSVPMREQETQQQEKQFTQEADKELKEVVNMKSLTPDELKKLDASLAEPFDTPHPHYKGSNQYLPLVYSYTEDFGLSLFCMYLKSLGFQYLLAHIKNPNLNEVITNAKSDADTHVGFPALTDANKATTPLCCLLHPTMTEGYDFVYNPAIFVLEPCNTFGDQEQVYGRVLRSYSEKAIATFHNVPRKKVVFQFFCLDTRDNLFVTKAKMIMMKYKFWKSRLLPTPAHLVQAFIKGAITSPDMHMMKRLKKEEQNLKNFETLISGGKDFADLVYSVLCLQESNTNVRNCNPFTGPSCDSQQGPAAPSSPGASSVPSEPRNVSNNNGSDPGSPASTPGSVGLTKSQKKRQRQKAKKLAEMQAENINNNNVLTSAFVQGRGRGGYRTRRRR